MLRFSLYAFIPFFFLLATALLSLAICTWIRLAPRPAPRRTAVHHCEILAFPAARPRQPSRMAAATNLRQQQARAVAAS